MSLFSEKVLMITGGTTSLGNAALKRLLNTDVGEIRIFSRDVKKQEEMKCRFQALYPEMSRKMRFFNGDVRDISSVKEAICGADYVIHAATLQYAPFCERAPMEAVKTNVIGTDNVLTASMEAGVDTVICFSTDKAAYPVNAMGISQAMMEKVAAAKSRISENTRICCTRCGTVLCSQGTVVPLWVEQIRAGKPMTLTDPRMTRFVMTLEEALDLVLFAFEHGTSGDILVQKAPACTIGTLALVVQELFQYHEGIKIIGMREGEKRYETLLTEEECVSAADMGDFYRVPCERQSFRYESFFMGENVSGISAKEYNSNNAELLDIEQIKKKLVQIPYIQEELRKAGIQSPVKRNY